MGATNYRHFVGLIIFALLIFVRSINAFGMDSRDFSDSQKHANFLDSAEILKLKGFYPESINLIKNVQIQSQQSEDWENYVRSLVELTDVLRFTYYYTRDPKTITEANNHLDEAYKTIIQHLDTNNMVLSRYYIYKGKLINDEGKYSSDTLEYYLQKAENILNNNQKNAKETAKLYYELGNYYRRISQISLAEMYFNKLLSALTKFDELDYFRAYYIFRANQFFYDIADLEKSMLCANIALHIFKHPKNNDIANALDCENDIAGIYMSSNILNESAYIKALSHYQKIYDILQPNFNDHLSPVLLFNMGIALKELNLYDSSIQSLRKSIYLNPHRTHIDSIRSIESELYINLISYVKNKSESSSDKLQKTLRSYLAFRGNKNYKAHVIQRVIGEEYEKMGNYDMALELYQNGLISLYANFNSKNIYENPKWENIDNIEPALYILFYKARTLFARYKATKNDADLLASFDIYQDGYNLMNKLLSSEMMNESFIILFQNFKTDFQTSVEGALEAYKQFSDRKYLNSAFHFIEQSKYFLLLKSQQNALLRNNSNSNKKLFLSERSISSEIENLKHQLNTNDSLSADKAFEIRNILLDKIVEKTNVMTQVHQILDTIEIDTNPRTLALNQVQKNLLKEHEIIIEYYWSEKMIYALLIERNHVEIIEIPVNKDLLEYIHIYTQALSNKHSSKDSFLKFTKSSYYLYQTLFMPIVNRIPESSDSIKNSYTIITDGALSFLPFEAFTTEEADTTAINYWGLPYLCKKYVTNYAYSLNILYKNILNNSNRKSDKILAMSYSPVFNMQGDIEVMRDKNELPYSGLEITEISKIFNNSDFYAYEEATEKQFKSLAEDFPLIHLAIHGQADTINRYNSKLLFRPNPGSQEDGQLHDYELYTLDLSNNQLAVLSACETGMGKQIEGEGIFSIARGFAYAGSPAIVMSLWKVNDKSTSMLMKYFYENLEKGLNKDKSLQLAKISYIENADELSAHPSNWAAFISLGNNKPIEIGTSLPWKNIVIISIVILVISLYFFKVRTK